MKKHTILDQHQNSISRGKPQSQQSINKSYQLFLSKQQTKKLPQRTSSPFQSKTFTSLLNKSAYESQDNMKTPSPIKKKSQSPIDLSFKTSSQKSFLHSILRPQTQQKIASKPQKVRIKSSRSHSKENYIDAHPPLFPQQYKSQQVVNKSSSAVNIFSESTKQLEELQHNSTYKQSNPELHKGILDILSLIKKEKQVIMNDLRNMSKQMQKYKKQYEDLQQELEDLRNENMRLADNSEEPDAMNETYAKMIKLLTSMGMDYKQILPELENQDHQNQEFKETLDKDEIIKLQKQIIKKQVKKIEDLRILNQMLMNKIKEQ